MRTLEEQELALHRIQCIIKLRVEVQEHEHDDSSQSCSSFLEMRNERKEKEGRKTNWSVENEGYHAPDALGELFTTFLFFSSSVGLRRREERNKR